MKKNNRNRAVDKEVIHFDVDGSFDAFYRHVRDAFAQMLRILGDVSLLRLDWRHPNSVFSNGEGKISVIGEYQGREYAILEIVGGNDFEGFGERDGATTRVNLTTHFYADRETTIRWRAEWLSLICKKHPEVRIGIERHIADMEAAQANQEPPLPTDPADLRLIESGMNEDHRIIVAMTNQGKTPTRIAEEMGPRTDVHKVNSILYTTRQHPLRAHLVIAARPRPHRLNHESAMSRHQPNHD